MKDIYNIQFKSQILNAIKNKKLVLFVGAGISKLCGLPLWYDLAVKLLKYCVNSDDYNFSSKDKELLLSSVGDSRELVTIASNIISKKSKDAFYGQLSNLLTVKEEYLSPVEKMNYSLIPNIIKTLANTVITTNADSIIDDQFDGDSVIFYSKKDIDKFVLKEEKQVFHIHGSIKKPEDMVFSTADYLKRYNLPNFSQKISNIFNNPDPDYAILIIGYSMSDLQLLDLIIKNEKLPNIERQKKTFLIKGYYSYEENVFEAEEEYYKEYGITLISYCKDKKGFQGLVDTLTEIKNMAEENSAININSTKMVVDLFMKKPTKDSFDVFLNEFSDFDNTRRDFSFSELRKSAYLSFWIQYMFSNEKCYEKYFDIKSNLPTILSDEYSFSSIGLITRIKYSELKNKSEVKEYLRSLLSSFIDNDLYFSNSNVATNLCRCIMTNPEYINMPESFNFIQKFNQQSYRDYWILFLCHENDVLLKTSKNILLKYSTLILESIYEKGDKEYYFNLFFNAYGSRLCSEIPNNIISVCERIINKEIASNEKYFITRDCFDELSRNDNDYYPIYKIYKMLLNCLKGLGDNELMSLYEKYKKHKIIFYRQLSIYICSIRYNVLEEKLFKDLMSFANERKYYAEIYSCILRNVNRISLNKISDLLDFIELIKFDNYSEIWNLTAKKYLLEALSNNVNVVKNQKYNLLKLSVYSEIDKKYSESINSMPSPQNMSKSAWSSISSWSKDKTLFNNLKDLDDNQFYIKLKEVDLNDFDVVDNIYELLDLRDKKSFITFLKNNNLLKDISSKLGNLIINSFNKSTEDEIEASIQCIIEIVDSTVNKETKTELKENCFDTLYFIIHKINNKPLYSSLFDKVFSFAFDTAFLSENDWKIKISNTTPNINDLYSAKVFEWLSVLIMTCSKNNWYKLKEFINNYIKDENKSAIIKASLCSNLHLLWNIDSLFIKENVKLIFDNTVDGVNYSFIGFELSMLYSSDFINLLFENGILIPLISNENFGLNWNLTYLIIYQYLYGKIDLNIIIELSKCDCFKSSLSSLINDFERNDVSKFSKGAISDLFKVIADEKFNGSDHCAVDLYKLSCKFEGVKFYLEAVLSLFSGKNSAFYAKDLLENLSISEFNDEEKEIIISTYLNNLEEHYFYVDEILMLINEIKWSSNDNKLKVINKLGKTNPVFFTKFSDN